MSFLILFLSFLSLKIVPNLSTECDSALIEIFGGYSGLYEIGEFRFSLNKCNSLKTTLNLPIISDVEMDGSFYLECVWGSAVMMSFYDDILCTGEKNEYPMSVGQTVSLFNGNLNFRLNSVKGCGESEVSHSCDIGTTVAANCSLDAQEQQSYLNMSVPPSACERMDDSGAHAILNTYLLEPYGNFDVRRSMNFSCSAIDQKSLLVFNYSDSLCSQLHDIVRLDYDTFYDKCYYSEDSGYHFNIRWDCNPDSYYDETQSGVPVVDAVLSETIVSCERYCLTTGWITYIEPIGIGGDNNTVLIIVVTLVVIFALGGVFYVRTQKNKSQQQGSRNEQELAGVVGGRKNDDKGKYSVMNQNFLTDGTTEGTGTSGAFSGVSIVKLDASDSE